MYLPGVFGVSLTLVWASQIFHVLDLKWVLTDFFEIRQTSKFVEVNYERLY